MKFAHHFRKQPNPSDDFQELEKLIKCRLLSESALAPHANEEKLQLKCRKWKLYVGWLALALWLCILLVYGALALVKYVGQRDVGQKSERHAHSSAYSMEPDGVDNVIECARPGRTLFIVINSRAQNLERRRKLRASWLNAANLRRELCGLHPSSGRSRFAAGAVPPPANGAHRPPARTINQSNRSLAHKARIGRIEWLFALGHVRVGGGGNHQDLTSRQDEKKSEELILGRERDQFNDLLMLPLMDSYRNITLKHLAIFEWLLKDGHHRPNQSIASEPNQTPGPDLLIKADDDAELDLAQMISKYVIESSNGPTDSHLLMCARFEAGSPVKRPGNDTIAWPNRTNNQTNKWALTRSEWPGATFPAYCSGLAYLATLGLAEQLNSAARLLGNKTDTPPLWIDDVYVTGVLLGRLPSDSYRVIKLNPYFCYTRAQKLHRESLEPGLKCMAYEDTTL